MNKKDNIRKGLSEIKIEVEKLHLEFDENLQIEILEMINAIENWLENDTLENQSKFINLSYICGMKTTLSDAKWSRLNRLIFKIRHDLLVYTHIKTISTMKEFLNGWIYYKMNKRENYVKFKKIKKVNKLNANMLSEGDSKEGFIPYILRNLLGLGDSKNSQEFKLNSLKDVINDKDERNTRLLEENNLLRSIFNELLPKEMVETIIKTMFESKIDNLDIDLKDLVEDEVKEYVREAMAEKSYF